MKKEGTKYIMKWQIFYDSNCQWLEMGMKFEKY
jgi:hypothetical protein